MINMLIARPNGEWMDWRFRLAGRLGNTIVEPEAAEMIPLPEGATLTLVPERTPVGITHNGTFQAVKVNPYHLNEKAFAVAALLPQGFTRTLAPAFYGSGDTLPLLGYTAVGIKKDGTIMVAAKQTDDHEKWHPKHYNTETLPGLIAAAQKQMPGNRVINQLGRCALEYGCFTAQNIFYRRWEAGLPVSPACNAQCIACISKQPAECCPSPQNRIDFTPTVAEGTAAALWHLSAAPDNIISFGQGCEGEPSLAAATIAQIIQAVRAELKTGTINMNTNAGDYQGLQKIIAAGIDSLRVSMISAIPEHYRAYYRPQYPFGDVLKSLAAAKAAGVRVALNLLAYPGFTDRASEIEALLDLVTTFGISQIQIRNLNIDPAVVDQLYPGEPGLGVLKFLQILEQELPGVKIGNYSQPNGNNQ